MGLPIDYTEVLGWYANTVQDTIRKSVDAHMRGINPRGFRVKTESYISSDSLNCIVRIAVMFHQRNCQTAAYKSVEFDQWTLGEVEATDAILLNFGMPEDTSAEFLGRIIGTDRFKELKEAVDQEIQVAPVIVQDQDIASIWSQTLMEKFYKSSAMKEMLEGSFEETDSIPTKGI